VKESSADMRTLIKQAIDALGIILDGALRGVNADGMAFA